MMSLQSAYRRNGRRICGSGGKLLSKLSFTVVHEIGVGSGRMVGDGLLFFPWYHQQSITKQGRASRVPKFLRQSQGPTVDDRLVRTDVVYHSKPFSL